MPIFYHIDDSFGVPVVRTTAAGAVSSFDLLQHSVMVLTDSRVSAGYRLCFELRPDVTLSVCAEEVTTLALVDRLSPKTQGALGAFVAQERNIYKEAKKHLAGYAPVKSVVRLFREKATAP